MESSNNPVELAQNMLTIQAEITMKLALSQPNQISGLRKKDPASLESVISLLVGNLLGSINVSTKLNPAQIEECSMLIISEFWMLRPEEILYVFKKVKSGFYGSFYNSLDASKILSCIRSYYDDERIPHFESQNSVMNQNTGNEEFMSDYMKAKEDTIKTGTNQIKEFIRGIDSTRNRKKEIENKTREAYAEYLQNRKPVEPSDEDRKFLSNLGL